MQKFLVVLFTALFFMTGCSRTVDQVLLEEVEPPVDASDEVLDAVEALSDASVEEPSPIVVYVCGAVSNPGVYELSQNSRINDAVIAAGGFGTDADTGYVNLAAPLSDGMKLRIPTLAETDSSVTAQQLPENYDIAENSTDTLININTASKEQLMTLPGIGEKVAERIIDFRTENGPFRKTEDIMKISGIKEKLFSKISDRITV